MDGDDAGDAESSDDNKSNKSHGSIEDEEEDDLVTLCCDASHVGGTHGGGKAKRGLVGKSSAAKSSGSGLRKDKTKVKPSPVLATPDKTLPNRGVKPPSKTSPVAAKSFAITDLAEVDPVAYLSASGGK